jgi:tetratricopeptide (TPR) repeat protein
VSLGLFTVETASADTIDGCTNAVDPRGAIADCTKIIDSDWATDRQVKFAYNNRASANEYFGNHDAAIDDYSRALQIDPHYATALYNRGSVYLTIGKPELAIADLDAAVLIAPKRAAAYHNRGLALLRLGDVAAAVADFKATLNIDPALAPAHNNLGVALRRIGDNAGAITEFSRAVDLMPDYAGALNGRGEVYLIEHRYEEAARDFSSVLAIDPVHVAASRNLAIVNEILQSGY